ncbi:MAG: hypothetical protein ABI809_00210 [Caldimonas sp.]
MGPISLFVSRWAPIAFAAALAGQAAVVRGAEASVESTQVATAPVQTAPAVSAAALSRMDVMPEATVSGSNPVEGDDSVALPSRWSSSAEQTGRNYRWALSRGALDIGMSFDAQGRNGRAYDFRSETGGPVASSLPSLSLGLRRTPVQPTSASTLLARAAGSSDSYLSKVGVEWKPAESHVNFLREGLGFRLEGSDRMTVRLRKGVLGVYMHHKW